MQIASGDLWAGAEVQIFNLASHLAKRPEVEVLVVLMNHGELERRLIERGVAVIVLDETQLNSWTLFRRLVALMREWHPDVVHTHRVKENILGGLAAAVNRVPSIRTVHGRPESVVGQWDFRRRTMRLIDHFAARFAQQKLVAVSDDLGDELRLKYGREAVAVIHNGIELPEPGASAPEHESRHRASSPLKVAVVARLVAVKRIDLVVAIAAELQQRAPGRFVFTVFGDGPLRAELAEDISVRGLSGVVELAGFQVDVTRRLKNYDAMLITSDHEGLPTNLLEAMSVGVPVIARSVGAIPDVLRGGELGSVISSDNEGQLVTAFADALERHDVSEAVLARAWHRAADYSAAATAGAYLLLFSNLVGRQFAGASSADRHGPSGDRGARRASH
jgi:glycosyltransferase involved in cell wall biosynthesis